MHKWNQMGPYRSIWFHLYKEPTESLESTLRNPELEHRQISVLCTVGHLKRFTVAAGALELTFWTKWKKESYYCTTTGKRNKDETTLIQH